MPLIDILIPLHIHILLYYYHRTVFSVFISHYFCKATIVYDINSIGPRYIDPVTIVHFPILLAFVACRRHPFSCTTYSRSLEICRDYVRIG